MRTAILVLLGLTYGCGDDGSAEVDAGPADGGGVDAGVSDAGVSDAGAPDAAAFLCPGSMPSSWIFCDDFETVSPPTPQYTDYYDDDGDFRPVTSEAHSGTRSMETLFQMGEVSGGGMWVSFGNHPIESLHRDGEDFDEIYWRIYVKHQVGWTGSPGALTTATSFWHTDQSRVMFAALGSNGDRMTGDPASCVMGSAPVCMGLNDPMNTTWFPGLRGTTPIFSTAEAGRWRCVEGHVALNTPGASDGVFEFWIDENREDGADDINFRGSYADYGINSLMIFNWWSDDTGSPQEQRRWFDDIVIATERIGCL